MTISIPAKSVSYLEYSMDHYLVKTFSNLMVPTRMVWTAYVVGRLSEKSFIFY